MLCAEAVPLDEIARAVGTPAYVYSAGHMRHQLQRFQDAFAGQRVMVCYALKANSNLAVIKTLADAGAGAEIVSGGELQRALAVGVPPDRIVFAGVAKSRDEMAVALDAGIAQFNVESVPELVDLERDRREPPAARADRACGSIPTSPPAATTRSAPGAGRTSSASPTIRRSRPTGWRRGWRASRWSGCICTSARRS